MVEIGDIDLRNKQRLMSFDDERCNEVRCWQINWRRRSHARIRWLSIDHEPNRVIVFLDAEKTVDTLRILREMKHSGLMHSPKQFDILHTRCEKQRTIDVDSLALSLEQCRIFLSVDRGDL